ncbi:MAG: cytochrome b N-terminal domain-containing protein [Thermodesulfovibrionales bacterium]|nr:cytochrome b N-terminal domain-containing protein [Thermodesulfovibrionales bacterium]
MSKFFDWLDKQFKIRSPHKRFFQRTIPPNINYTYCFGGIAFTYFLLLAMSGLLLTIYYIPTEKEAYNSVLLITNEVPLGWVIRGIHKWSASLYITFIIFHAIRVFLSRAYKPPRELNWMVGSLAFIASMASGFTGYLLPWDQKAYWATEVGTSMISTIPIAGKYIAYLVRGDSHVSANTLLRFYALHVLYLPLITIFLLWGHFHMIKRLGIASKY